jgi:hypothetical protein
MAHLKRLVASVLLAAGMLLVFGGLSAAVGFTPSGIVASIAVIAALLYAGAVWFGPVARVPGAGAPVPLVVFDRHGRIVTGAEIEQRCAAALAGTGSRFPCLHQGRMVVFDALPVRSADGAIVYGILLSADAEPAAIAATA